MLKYKINVLDELKLKGYSTYSIRKDKLLGERSIQQIRKGSVIGINSLDKLCDLLGMQPGDIIEWVDDENCTK